MRVGLRVGVGVMVSTHVINWRYVCARHHLRGGGPSNQSWRLLLLLGEGRGHGIHMVSLIDAGTSSRLVGEPVESCDGAVATTTAVHEMRCCVVHLGSRCVGDARVHTGQYMCLFHGSMSNHPRRVTPNNRGTISASHESLLPV